MYKQALNADKVSAQIIVKDSCAGITLYPVAEGLVIDGEEFPAFGKNLKVRVELVRKSQPNAVLYNMTLEQLYNVYGAFLKKPKGFVIPFALKENLLLSNDSYLQVDLEWGGFDGILDVESLSVQRNTLATSGNVPISFKKVVVDGELDVNTEHYGYVLIPNTITRIETFVDTLTNTFVKPENTFTTAKAKGGVSLGGAPTLGGAPALGGAPSFGSAAGDTSGGNVINTGACGCDGRVKTAKIEMDFAYLTYHTAYPTDSDVIFKTEPNQYIKFSGVGTVLLMQA